MSKNAAQRSILFHASRTFLERESNWGFGTGHKQSQYLVFCFYPPIFLWVCRRQIASSPLLLLQVHGSPLMKGLRDLWGPERPIHLFHCTKSPRVLGGPYLVAKTSSSSPDIAIYWGGAPPDCTICTAWHQSVWLLGNGRHFRLPKVHWINSQSFR